MLHKNLFAAKDWQRLFIQCIIMSIYSIFFILKNILWTIIPFRASYHNRVVSSNLGDWSHFEELITLLSQTIILINVNVRNKSNNFVFHFNSAYPGIMWPKIAPFIVTRVCKFRLLSILHKINIVNFLNLLQKCHRRIPLDRWNLVPLFRHH